MLLNRLMEKYYVLKELFTADQWAEYIVEKIHASGKRIEIVESFQHKSESTMRQLATERNLLSLMKLIRQNRRYLLYTK